MTLTASDISFFVSSSSASLTITKEPIQRQRAFALINQSTQLPFAYLRQLDPNSLDSLFATKIVHATDFILPRFQPGYRSRKMSATEATPVASQTAATEISTEEEGFRVSTYPPSHIYRNQSVEYVLISAH